MIRVRPKRGGKGPGWEVDIRFAWPDGSLFRERKNTLVAGKAAAKRWGKARESELREAGKEAYITRNDPPPAPLPTPIGWPRLGGVYFVRCGDRVKIGVAVSISARLQRLQTASAEPLELLAVAPGGFDEERAYHARFQEHRHRGEWFNLSAEILEEIRILRGL